MPNRSTHALVGALAGGTVAASRVTGEATVEFAAETVGGLIGGWAGGVLPDLLEPATSPHHRQTAHSMVAAGALTMAKVAEWQAACRSASAAARERASVLPLGCQERNDAELAAVLWRLLAGILVGLVVGYGSHLALDACTPRGLPLIGRLK
jgi:membrane-bound metal-dependent hydrolase YbcI (DUF457 family)